ncbi:MAG: UpxY family transcription antiterminator [Prevotella sp.]|nr:UpxY family transcription antiterminator [Prevotella sp.]
MEQLLRKTKRDKRWYVLSANYKKEITVRDELVALGYQAYVPMKYELIKVKGQRQRLLRPAIHELVFVRASQEELLEYKHSSRNNPYIFFRSTRLDHGWSPIVVRDVDMENFIKLTAMSEIGLTYFKPEELRLAKGQQVRIMDGIFKDIVGTVQKLPHKQGDYLVVEIPGVSVVAARIKPDFVQPIDRQVARSTNVDADVKRLSEIACQLLYDLPDTTANESARCVLIGELQTIRQALDGCKTFMPIDKVGCALAHFLAAKALGEDEESMVPYTHLLQTITPKLRSVSLLRLRASIYLALCLHDEEAARFVDATLSHWSVDTCSDRQKHILTEKRLAEKRFLADKQPEN